MSQDINRILDFWFSLPMQEWYSDKHDDFIVEKFSGLVEKAKANELDSWTDTPSGALAVVLLLDQFTRNIYRDGRHPNPGLSWSGDKKALSIASTAVTKGWDKEIQREFASHTNCGFSHRCFFYLPFMHAEDIANQIASCSLWENVAQELEIKRLRKLERGEEETEQEKGFREQTVYGVAYAARHRDCVSAVGRFPKRNEPLGRDSTVAEKEWLEKYPEGF